MFYTISEMMVMPILSTSSQEMTGLVCLCVHQFASSPNGNLSRSALIFLGSNVFDPEVIISSDFLFFVVVVVKFGLTEKIQNSKFEKNKTKMTKVC